MGRNRKSQSAAVRFGPALKAVVLCLLIGGAGVGYVWQKDQIQRLGKQIKDRELRLARQELENEQLRKQFATMRSPQSLEARIRELNLGLAPAQPGQIWRLPEPVPDAALPSTLVQYAVSGAQVSGTAGH